jgi:inner membrane protein
MTGRGHMHVGIVSTIAMFYFAKNELNYDNIESTISCVGLLLGSTAPDYLEIRKKNGGTLIKHRTITHWLPLWILLSLFSLLAVNVNIPFIPDQLYNLKSISSINFHSYISSILVGFSFGGLLHLLVDLPNPMGIPILTPYHRFSLKLWNSGKLEPLIVFVFFLISCLYVDFININTDLIKSYL